MRSLKFFLVTLLSMNFVYGWEDHPDLQDHRKTDRIFKIVQRITDCDAYEMRLMSKEEKKSLNHFKLTKSEIKNRRGYVLERD